MGENVNLLFMGVAKKNIFTVINFDGFMLVYIQIKQELSFLKDASELMQIFDVYVSK